MPHGEKGPVCGSMRWNRETERPYFSPLYENGGLFRPTGGEDCLGCPGNRAKRANETAAIG